MITPEQFLAPGSSSAKFEDVGDFVQGTIVGTPVVQQQKEYGTGKPKTYSDGNPMYQLAVTLQTDQQRTHGDDGRRTVYVRGQMRRALVDALREAKVQGLAEGGLMRVSFTGYGEAKGGGNAPKLYDVKYRAPQVAPVEPEPAPMQAATPADDPWGGQQQATPQPQPAETVQAALDQGNGLGASHADALANAGLAPLK